MYIGLTTISYNIRWKQHINSSLNNNSAEKNIYFHKELKKYGIDNFKWEVIEECDNSLLSEREIYWISYYDSYNNGYNSTLGGEQGEKYTDEEILSAWNSGLTIQQIHEKYGFNRGNFSNRLKSLGVTQEEINKRKYKEIGKKNSERLKGTNLQKVYQYDLQGNFIKEFNSVKEAELSVKGNVSKCLSGKTKSAGKFQWTYFYKDHIDPITPNSSPKIKKINQYTLNGEYITTYNNASVAAKAINGDNSEILKACKGIRKTANGYIWKYMEDEDDKS